MKVISCLSDRIEDELHDAENYIDLAMTYKNEDEDVANLFYELSTEEMGHMEKLHAEVVDQIRVYREEHGEPPAGMLALYNHLHEKHMKDAMRIKVKQGMYKA